MRLTQPGLPAGTIRPSGMTCARRGAGVHPPAASSPSRSPSAEQAPPEDRSRPEPRGGRTRRALLLPVLALLAGALGLFAAVPAQAQTTVWSATLTVDKDGNYYGCRNSLNTVKNCSDSDNLSEDEFTYGGTTYTVADIYWFDGTTDDYLYLRFNSAEPDAAKTALGALTLNVGGTAFAISSANVNVIQRFLRWSHTPNPVWTDGQTISLSLTEPADTTGPSVTGAPAITSSPPANQNGNYTEDDNIAVTVTFDEAIVVVGSPTLKILVGTAEKTATCAAHATDNKKLVCTYTVAEGDNDEDGVSVAANKLSRPTNVTIKDAKGNDASLDHAALPAQSAHKVDAKAPVITGLAMASTPAAAGIYAASEVIKVEVIYDEAVAVTIDSSGWIRLPLNVGTATRNATCVHKGSTGEDAKRLVCSYTVAADDEDTDGVSVVANALSAHEDVDINDDQGYGSDLNHAVLLAQSGHKVDAKKPAISFPTAAPQVGFASTITLTDATAKIKKYGAIVVSSPGAAANCDTAAKIGMSNLTTLATPSASVSFAYTVPSGSAGKRVCAYAEDAAGNIKSQVWNQNIQAGLPAPRSFSVWQARLTVVGNIGGCDDDVSGATCSSKLTDNDFTYAGTSYEIDTIELEGGTLTFYFDKAVPVTTRNALTLHVGNSSFALEDGSWASDKTNVAFSNTGITWTNNQKVVLELTRTAAVPSKPTGFHGDGGQRAGVALLDRSERQQHHEVPVPAEGGRRPLGQLDGHPDERAGRDKRNLLHRDQSQRRNGVPVSHPRGERCGQRPAVGRRASHHAVLRQRPERAFGHKRHERGGYVLRADPHPDLLGGDHILHGDGGPNPTTHAKLTVAANDDNAAVSIGKGLNPEFSVRTA